MIDRLKIPVTMFLGGVLFCYSGYKAIRYFTYSTPPVAEITGIINDGTYAGTVSGGIVADNPYKINTVKVMLDGKPLVEKSIRSCRIDESFSLDTTKIQEGAHTLELVADDTSHHHNMMRKQYQFNVDNVPLRVALDQAEYTVDQGKTLHIKAQANKKIAQASMGMLSSNYTLYPVADGSTCYECFIPIATQERGQEGLFSVDIKDAVGNAIKLPCKVTIKPFEFPKQRGFTVSPEKLAQEKEASMSSKILNEALERWVKDSPKRKLWNGAFDFPVDVQRTSTPFGEIRVTPERGRYMHCGIDLISRPRSVVWAAQAGKVIIKDRFFLTGNTVVVDHGLGVFSLYAHLDSYADIEVGDIIKKGNPVGTLGMTGYATGYHLHWELRINNVPVDPLEWTDKVF